MGIENVVMELNSEKATGLDGIVSEHLNFGSLCC